MTQIYVAASSAGANNGTNCANARAYTSLVGGDYTGNTIHVCGTITGGANSTLFTVGGNGTTILFETGAVLQAPYFNYPNGAITCSGHSTVTIDGGTNGTIQNTADGTALANQQNTAGVGVDGCSSIVVKNLIIHNLYIRTEGSEDGAESAGILMGGDHSRSTNNTIDHARIGSHFGYCGNTDVEFDHNHYTFSQHQDYVGNNNAGCNMSNLRIHDEDFGGGAYLWDALSNSNHHNAIHIFAVAPVSTVTGVVIYNNYVHGQWSRDSGYGGTHITAGFFLETIGSGTQIYNNIIDFQFGALNKPANGYIFLKGCCDSTHQDGNSQIYNNTFVGDNTGGTVIGEEGGSTGANVRNNITTGVSTAQFLTDYPGSPVFAVSNFNDFFGVGNTGFGNFDTFAGWQGHGFDATSILTNPNLNSTTYLPAAGSPVINAGTNLTSLGITTLNVDKSGIARPAAGAWSIGALQVTGGSVIVKPNPPTGLVATPN